MPYIAQSGGDHHGRPGGVRRNYPTEDGTGVRDYIHVMDLAATAAMRQLADKPGVHNTTSAPVLATACWMWLTLSAKPAVNRSTITSPPPQKETSQHTGLMQPKPIKSLTGDDYRTLDEMAGIRRNGLATWVIRTKDPS